MMSVARIAQYALRLCQALPDKVFGKGSVAGRKQPVQITHRDIERHGNLGRAELVHLCGKTTL